MTQVATKNGRVATEGAESAPAQEGRNVHQRKLAVMAKCGDISLDKKHGQGFDYLSIGHASNCVRRYCVEEGLDPEVSVTDGMLVLTLTNADDPSQILTSTWPLVPNDKAWAYTTKYALVRTFLIGDGEEGDEAEMASNSAAQTVAEVQRVFAAPQRPTPAPGAATRKPLGDCPECAELGITAASGKPAVYWPPRKPGQLPQCNGIEGGVYMNHQLREGGQPAGDIDPDSIPF